MYFLGIDSGTQSTKAIVLDFETRQDRRQRAPQIRSDRGTAARPPGAAPGGLDQGGGRIRGGMRAEARARTRSRIAGIGVSGQQHGLVVLDAKDEVVRPAKLWCDTSTAAQCDQIAHEFGGQPGCIHLAGNAMLPGYTIPKLLWLKQNEPQNFAKRRLDPAAARLPQLLAHRREAHGIRRRQRHGHPQCAHARSGATRSATSSTSACATCCRRSVHRCEAHGTLRPELAKKWGLSDKVCHQRRRRRQHDGRDRHRQREARRHHRELRHQRHALRVAAEPVVDGQGEVAAFCDSTDQWLPLVCTMNVTVVTEQVREMFGWTHPAARGRGRQRARRRGRHHAFCRISMASARRTCPNGTGVLHGLSTTNMTPAEHRARRGGGRDARTGVWLAAVPRARHESRRKSASPAAVRRARSGGRSRRMSSTPRWSRWRRPRARRSARPSRRPSPRCKPAGKVRHIEELTARLVTLDETTRCKPDAANAALYGERLEKLTGITRRLHEVEYL